MSELSVDQKIEMMDEKRRLHGVGDAAGAMAIKKALDDDRYFMGLAVVEEAAVTQPKPNAKKSAWVRFALEVSDMDPDIVEAATRGDIIGMLKANGLAE